MSEKGIALLIVVSILTVVAIMGVSFVFSMFLETQASKQFSVTAQARYIAEAGISHARAILDEDRLGSRVDDLTESWVDHLEGDDVDVDVDGSLESRWWIMEDTSGTPVGRYGVLINDEGSKVNLNTAVADPNEAGLQAIDLTALLAGQGIADASSVARAIEQYRYGDDGQPGTALVDDDRDGAVDEPDEYQSLALRGDDRRFERLEELLNVGGLDADALKQLAQVVTVYSWDPNLSVTGQPRFNVNTATAEELLSALLEAGSEDPWQLAANMADYVDPDLAISKVSKMAQPYLLNDQGAMDGWVWQTSPVSHYATSTPNSQLSWEVAVPSGVFRVLVLGVPGTKVGDVDLQGQTKESMESGESFGILELSGPLTVRVTHGEAAGTPCAFRGLELVADEAGAGFPTVVVRGIEAIRFNELMVAPTITLPVQDAVFDPQLSGWSCQGQLPCMATDPGTARWTWTVPSLQPGQYYVKVFGRQAGDTVGDVTVSSFTEPVMVDGQRHPHTMVVGSDKKVTLTIGKTPSDGTYYFKSLTLSLEPDAEYVELINMSDGDLDVGGWVIEGEVTGGRQARLPMGAAVKAHQVLVAAVDANDSQAGLAGNGIDVRSVWEVPSDANLVQLEFSDGALTPDVDWLSDTPPPQASARLVLRDNEFIVDEIEYPLPLPLASPFQSIEKGDPSVVVDDDGDGLDSSWYPSLALYTPGAPNDNDGLRELQGLETIIHNPATEVTVLNRALNGVGELAGVPSGIAWNVVASYDLARFVDRLTVEGFRLETEGYLIEGQQDWHETVDGYETSQQESVATWQWMSVPDGRYRLSLYGWSGEQLSVRWQRADGSYSEWVPALSADAQGRIVVGQVTVGLPESLPNLFTLQARCESPGGVCHLNHIWLDTTPLLVGVINVNTAPQEVLASLPGITDGVIQQLVANRPYGDQEHKARGIGDLLIGSVLGEAEEDRLQRFRQWAHLLTVRSQVFHIMSLGEPLTQETPKTSQRIQAIIQR